MKTVLSISILIIIFSFGCSNTKEFTISYTKKPEFILTSKPIIVRSSNTNGNHLKNLIINELKSNGYRVMQDIETTNYLLDLFGANQVIPLDDFTEILVSMELGSNDETSKDVSKNVKLAYCDYNRQKDICTYSDGTVKHKVTSIKRTGKASIIINNAGKEPVKILFNVTAFASGILPSYTNVAMSNRIQEKVRGKLKKYFLKNIRVLPEFEIDEMAADFINDKLYEAAKIRVMYKETGFKYYYTLGLIEESQKNYSAAKMYYSEGELNTDQFDQKEVFSDSIARIESRNKN